MFTCLKCIFIDIFDTLAFANIFYLYVIELIDKSLQL